MLNGEFGFTGVSAVSAGNASACALLANGSVWCWGRNDDGVLGKDGTTTPQSLEPALVSGLFGGAAAISVGVSSACAVFSDGSVVECWGGNSVGELGNGTTLDSATHLSSKGALTVLLHVQAHSRYCAETGPGYKTQSHVGRAPSAVCPLGTRPASPESASASAQRGSPNVLALRFKSVGKTDNGELLLRARTMHRSALLPRACSSRTAKGIFVLPRRRSAKDREGCVSDSSIAVLRGGETNCTGAVPGAHRRLCIALASIARPDGAHARPSGNRSAPVRRID